jgi:hypothetical protein
MAHLVRTAPSFLARRMPFLDFLLQADGTFLP